MPTPALARGCCCVWLQGGVYSGIISLVGVPDLLRRITSLVVVPDLLRRACLLACEQGLKPILCIGESQEEYNQGLNTQVPHHQHVGCRNDALD